MYSGRLNSAGTPLTFIPFRGHTMPPGKVGKQCFSQWFPCDFTVDGVAYHTAEQYMMAQKALLFEAQEVCIWRGENLPGFAIMTARDELLKQ